jgi:hypothetical protein
MEPAAGFRFVEQPPFAQVSELMRQTWHRPCWNYDVGLLGLHILKPSGDPTLAIGQVEETTGRLASYQAYMPFEVEYLGKPYHSVFASFLTVSPAFQGRGLAGPQQARLVEKAMDKGYDLYLTMCEVGAPSNHAVEKTFARFGIAVSKLKVLHYRASTLALVDRELARPSSLATRRYRPEDREQVLALAQSTGRGTQLRKVIPERDIDFLFLERPHAVSFVYETRGRVRGLLNVLVLEVLEETDMLTNLYFENVLFGDLDLHEEEEFLGDVLKALHEVHFQMAFVPDIGYAPMRPFEKYHFRAMPRELNLLCAPLDQAHATETMPPVGSFYLDVY